jgi:transcription elongation factor SPT6
VHDNVARIYHHSKRAPEEFSALPPNAKYCVGLARYVQSPLNEFVALGPDITAISLDKDNQHLVRIYLFLFLYYTIILYRFPKTNCLLHSRKFSLISPIK